MEVSNNFNFLFRYNEKCNNLALFVRAMRFCIHCGKEIPEESNFCTHCGLPQSILPPRPVYQQPSTAQSVRLFGSTLGTFLSLVMFIVAVVTLIGLYIGIPTMAEVWDNPVSIFIILNGIVNLFTLDNSLLIFYIFFIAVLLVSFILLIMRSKDTFARELTMKPVKEHSPLYTICTLIMAMTAISLIVQVVIPALFGQTSHVLPIDDEKWQILYSIAEPPVWEELISRVLLLGIPLLVIDLVLNAVNKKYERKPLRRYILGGGFSFGAKEIIFLLISSSLFGYAHFSGWDAYKIIPAAIAGLSMGYVFLKYGLYASISFHAINNMIGLSTYLYDGIGYALIIGIISLLIFLLGIPYLVNYTYKLTKWISMNIEQRPKGATPQPLCAEPVQLEEEPKQEMQNVSGANTIGFRCKNCGNDSAVFENGELVCTRCGFKN